MKIAIYALLFVQSLLFLLGIWQVFQPGAGIQLAGVFNLVFNSIFGVMNVRTLRNIRNAG